MTWPAFGPTPILRFAKTCGLVTPSTPGPKILTAPRRSGGRGDENDCLASDRCGCRGISRLGASRLWIARRLRGRRECRRPRQLDGPQLLAALLGQVLSLDQLWIILG